MSEFLWISEADVVSVMDLADAIHTIEVALPAEARGEAKNLEKTVVAWEGGTLHALGGIAPGSAATKTWAHTDAGATPLLVLFDSTNGSLKAVIEALALGQLRTGAISGVATRWLSKPDAEVAAVIGTGRQALPQAAAIAAVRPLKQIRVFGRNEEKRRAVATRIREELGIEAIATRTVEEAVKDAAVITTATRARAPFLTSRAVADGAHINAIGAIIRTGAELMPDIVARSARVVVDSVSQAQKLSRELEGVEWDRVQTLSRLLVSPSPRKASDVTLFKSLGIGVADLALASEIYRRSVELGLGRPLPHPQKASPRLRIGTPPKPRRAYSFVDQSGAPAPKHRPQDPVVITREEIEAETARLAGIPQPANGRRMSLIVNPNAGVGNGLAPGTAVSLSVLKPGERTKPIRHNVSLMNFCIGGRGTAIVDGKRIQFSQYDAWNIPPWSIYQHVNDGNELQVRLTYSNSALLEKLNVHVIDEEPKETSAGVSEGDDERQPNPYGTQRLTDEGAYIMPYEKLINPDVVHMDALHWPWVKVKEQLDKLVALGSSYVGRRLYLLYNPATGRTNGTSHTFFATICLRPANIVDKPHRHTASAINYFFKGSGWSVIEGKRYEWKAGDLMLTAPGWAIHNHASHGEDVYELTIQDSPLHIAMGSLLWQEDLTKPPQVLGTTGGFATNRDAQEVARR
ncbi:MAG TPA: cupin domain-containing protein [Thermoanaerobaculia bacterium]|nr:cupin domain-containing protein [Thermoanaerobaculia bacterium]